MAVDLDPATTTTVRLFRRESPVTVLGPGRRAVIWVQGCPFACKGCIVPESWDAHAGTNYTVADLAQWILDQPDIEGITISGGEPMEQADALADLIDLIRTQSDLGAVCYTGYTIESLRRSGSTGQTRLLDRCDMLIDGVYLQQRHADLRWRGSSNQRLIPLSDRYRPALGAILDGQDRSAGIEFFVDGSGAFGFAGVPHQPGFRAELEARLAGAGITPSK